MKSPASFSHPLLSLALCSLLGGCLFKPSTVTTRTFVLTPVSASVGSPGAGGHLPIGVGLVKMPAYLMRAGMAVRKGTNEVEYLETALWAEHLDQSFQRTMAANLGSLVPTDQVRLTTWQRAEVALAVHVNVEQFDVDAAGHGCLRAWWRITAPATDRMLRSGESRLSRTGPSPEANPQAMAALLSDLTADLSQVLAQAIRESASSASAGR